MSTVSGSTRYGVLSVPRIVYWIGVGLFVIAGLSTLVGFAGSSWHKFDWQLASVFGTALGTTALAGFTGALAYTTSGDVRATWELASLTERDQAERERPVVIQYEAGFSGSPQSGALKVVLFNAGLGPALRVDVRVRYVDPGHPFETTYIHPAIRAEGTAEFSIPVQFQEPFPPDGVRGDGFLLTGSCRDRSQRHDYPIITEWPRAAEAVEREQRALLSPGVSAVASELRECARIAERCEQGQGHVPSEVAHLLVNEWRDRRGQLMPLRDEDKALWEELEDTYALLRESKQRGGHPPPSADLRRLADRLNERLD